MFSQPTVFVVGAGASYEFGMPLGLELMRRIGTELDFTVGLGSHLRALIDARFNGDRRYYEAARNLSRTIGVFSFDSIDEVLHWFSANDDIVSIGKAAVVQQILVAEPGSKIFSERSIAKDADSSLIWVPHFLSMAVGMRRKEEISNCFSNVTIINFNYDRIIEHYIYSQLQTKLDISEEDARKAISNLNMIRPYGTVGNLPWQQDGVSGIPFGADLGPDHHKLFELSQNIYTYTEGKVERKIREDIESALIGARLIVFLGFGFHQQNMNLIKARDRRGAKQVIATVLGIASANFSNMEEEIRASTACTSTPQLLDQTCVGLMLTMKPTLLNPRRENE
jgi:hypothetical protein